MTSSIGKNEIGKVFNGALPISQIYVGSNLVWEVETTPIIIPPTTDQQACFSGDIWDDTLPWIDEEVWKLSV